MRRARIFRHAGILGIAALIASGLAGAVRAQHTPDPYNIVGEYNMGYENYMYPSYPNAAGFSSNQGILQSRAGYSRANQFQNFVQELDGVGSNPDALFAPSGIGRGGIQPYYRSFREPDQVFQRPYEPLLSPVGNHAGAQKLRTEKYLEYLREPDPKKRAQLYKEYNDLSLRTARDIGSGSTRSNFLRGATGAARPATPLPGATAPASPSRRPADASARSRGVGESPSDILDRAESRSRSAAPSRATSRTAPR